MLTLLYFLNKCIYPTQLSPSEQHNYCVPCRVQPSEGSGLTCVAPPGGGCSSSSRSTIEVVCASRVFGSVITLITFIWQANELLATTTATTKATENNNKKITSNRLPLERLLWVYFWTCCCCRRVWIMQCVVLPLQK